ncbi:MAG: peptidase S16 [Actinobacteria bacterium]|nr:MAG: peptidase S16 [Actinomycetota bacterium]
MTDLPYSESTVDASPRLRTWRGPIFILLGAVLALVGLNVPLPYVVFTPGPTVDVTMAVDNTPMIDIVPAEGSDEVDLTLDPLHQEGDGTGELRMVTVSEHGGPGNRITLFDLLRLGFIDGSNVVSYDSVYPPEATADEVQSAAQAQMRFSQSTAAVVALEELGWKIPATVTILGAVPGTDSENKVQEGDTLLSITTPDGELHPMDSASAPFSLMRTIPEGSSMVLGLERDGKELSVTVVSGPSPDNVGSKLGVFLDPVTTMPLDVDIRLEKIGGSSAGMMFALGIIDRMTPGDLSGGKVIAGTGALSYDGQVEPIGGINQKIAGALRDGATWFLAPDANCSDVEDVPEGIRVVSVATIDDAQEAVNSIAEGKGDSLPTCHQ